MPYEYNEIQSKINADVNSAATLTEITRFFKPENLIQTEETWVISGAGNKNGKCFKNMNYSAVTVSRGRWLIHYLICILVYQDHEFSAC